MDQEGTRSGWTVDTLHVFLVTMIQANDKRYEQRFAEQKAAVDAALAAADRAVVKAEAASDKRFEGVNEFRAVLSDQQRLLLLRSEADVTERAVNERVSTLDKGINDKLNTLKEQMDRLQAERLGIKGGWGSAVGVVGLVALVVSIILTFLK